MNLGAYATEFLAALWGHQEDKILSSFQDLAASWRAHLLADPYAAALPLPYQDQLAQIIRTGILDAAGGVLHVSALEAGLAGNAPGVLSLLGDYYGDYGLELAGSVAQATQQSVRAALVNGMRSGMGEREIASSLLPKILPVASSRLRTIARTELTNSATLTRVAVFKGAGVTRFVFNNVLDDRSTKTCSHADGLVLDLNNPLHAQLSPAAHFRCRSILVPAGEEQKTSSDKAVSEALAIRQQEFPNWTPRLAPFLTRILRGEHD